MGLLQLIFQSCLMAGCTYAVSLVPLLFYHRPRHGNNPAGASASRYSHASTPYSLLSTASETWLSSKSISVFSVGLLVSTAMAVILPEGVAVLWASTQTGREGEREGEVHEHLEDGADEGGVVHLGSWIGLALCSGFLLMWVSTKIDMGPRGREGEARHRFTDADLRSLARSPTDSHSTASQTRNIPVPALHIRRFCIHQYAGSHSHPRRHAVDDAPRGQGLHRLRIPGSHHDATKDVESGSRGRSLSHSSINPSDPPTHDSRPSEYFAVASSANLAAKAGDPLDSTDPNFSTYVGLLFHALADGISLGAAASISGATTSAPASPGSTRADYSSDASGTAALSAVIFLSLLVHKAPVAFSLSTLLVSSPSVASGSQGGHGTGLSPVARSTHSQIGKALAIFALATPVGALATWVILKGIAFISWSTSLGEGAEEDGSVGGPFAGSMRGRLEFWSESWQ